jgi:hypothetical protein
MLFKKLNFGLFSYFLEINVLFFLTVIGNGQEVKDLPNKCEGTDYSVKVVVVQPVNFSGREFYLLEYSYEFKNRATIFIKHIGELSAKGKMKHLYEGKSLEFLVSENGKGLCKIELKPNKRPSEGGADDVPSSSVFNAYKSSPALARSNSEFLEKLTNLLNNSSFTYRITNQNGITTVISNYRRLDDLPRNLVGEIAVQVSFPQQVNGNRFSFYIYYHARQKPRRSEEWENISPENLQVVNNFINYLIQELN